MNINAIHEQLKIFETVALDEKTHKYTWIAKDGSSRVNKTSMTTLIHQYTNPFDQEAEAARYAERYKLDKDEVLKEWQFNNKLSLVKGTAIHNYLEYLFSNIPTKFHYNVYEVVSKLGYDAIADKWEKLTQIADSFHNTALNFLIPIACELKMADDETNIAGAIDLLCMHKQSGDLIIVDYKSGKEIRQENVYDKWMLDPFTHLPDINYIHYSLQLNGYQYILEKNTSLRLRSRHYIIHIHEDQDSYEIIETLNLYKEARWMIEHS